MPTYLNSGTTPVALNGVRLEPGESKTLQTFLLSTQLPSGVTQTAATPAYDPILVSQKVTTTQTITLPATAIGNHTISIYCSSGEVSVKFNSASATAFLLATGLLWSRQLTDRFVDSIIFTISSGTAYLTIEKS